MIRALIFDFDGLILDTESPLRASWMEIYEQAGLQVDKRVWASMLGGSADPQEAYDLLEQHLKGPIDRDRIHTRRLLREREILAGKEVMPGVRELIAAAQELGLRLAVSSSSDRAWVLGHLEERGLLDEFDVVTCEEDVSETKPEPDLYLRSLERLDVRPEEGIAFEDSEHGVAAAKAAGLFCVAVPNAVTSCLTFAEADLVVSSLDVLSLQAYIDAAEGSGRT